MISISCGKASSVVEVKEKIQRENCKVYEYIEKSTERRKTIPCIQSCCGIYDERMFVACVLLLYSVCSTRTKAETKEHVWTVSRSVSVFKFLGSFNAFCLLVESYFDALDELDAEERIVGGSNVPSEEYVPYQVSMQYFTRNQYRHFCGGSIVSPTRVLTAAHYVYEQNPERLTVVTGIRDLRDKTGQRSQVKGYVVHENYEQFSVVIERCHSQVEVLQRLPYTTITNEECKERMRGGKGACNEQYFYKQINYITILLPVTIRKSTSSGCVSGGMLDEVVDEKCVLNFGINSRFKKASAMFELKLNFAYHRIETGKSHLDERERERERERKLEHRERINLLISMILRYFDFSSLDFQDFIFLLVQFMPFGNLSSGLRFYKKLIDTDHAELTGREVNLEKRECLEYLTV
uniref:Lectizyme n=1 Tax=Glossina pallidipes TaxID=7398 RepID=A0A1A9ZTA7_GLOPL